LREVFSDLYSDGTDTRCVVADAGLDVRYIEFTGKSINIWHSVLEEANKKQKVDEIFRVAFEQYPSKSDLQDVLHSARNARVQGKK